MSSSWQAIHFILGQTVKEFAEQFSRLDPDAKIPWESLGGFFLTGEPSPHDGRTHFHLPLNMKDEEYESNNET